jgi:hypothetical protein
MACSKASLRRSTWPGTTLCTACGAFPRLAQPARLPARPPACLTPWLVSIPDCLVVTAECPARGEDGGPDICMAVRHVSLPFTAVQFHPESILTDREHGLRILANAVLSGRPS